MVADGGDCALELETVLVVFIAALLGDDGGVFGRLFRFGGGGVGG